MKLQKKLIRIGDSLGVVLNKVLTESNNWKEGDIVDISDICLVRTKEEQELIDNKKEENKEDENVQDKD